VTRADTQPETRLESECRPLSGCITCSDEGIPMRVLQVDEARALALCEDAGGARSTVEIALVDAAPGDHVLVHAGTAIA
jgi:hydrogenase expression/formation protein HypC